MSWDGISPQTPELNKLNFRQLVVRKLGRVDYHTSLTAMQEFTRGRHHCAGDQIWLLEHEPVYTQGYSCERLPSLKTTIPIVKTDRGGQLTYHGPGQLVVYLLLDIRRRNQGIRNLIHTIESAVVALLRCYGIEGGCRPSAPGVYVRNKKIASVGIRVSRGCTYHGLSLNVDVDTYPFEVIDVCGYRNLEVTTMRRLGVECNMETIQTLCAEELSRELGYLQISYRRGLTDG